MCALTCFFFKEVANLDFFKIKISIFLLLLLFLWIVGDAQISLGRENRRDFVNGLWVGGDGNMSNKIGVGKVLQETTGKRWRAF